MKRIPEILEDATNESPVLFRHLVDRLTAHRGSDRQVKEFEREIIAWHRGNPQSRELERSEASALYRRAHSSHRSRTHEVSSRPPSSARLGLVPRESSTGGKATLLGMSKRGDAYLRTAAHRRRASAILAAKTVNHTTWMADQFWSSRRHPNIAAVALANKNVRTVWAMLRTDERSEADYVPDQHGRIIAWVTDENDTQEMTTHRLLKRSRNDGKTKVRPGLAKPTAAAAP